MTVAADSHVRWLPDEGMPEVAMAGRLRIADLSSDDAAYVVAELTRRGVSAPVIAERLGCKERNVKRIRASGMVQTLREQWRVERERDALRKELERVWVEVEWARAGCMFLQRFDQSA